MKCLAIAKKDLLLELRSKNMINFMILFSLVTLVLFSYTMSFADLQSIAPSLLWFIFIFVGMLGLSRAFIREKELGTLDGLKIAPIQANSILIGKIIFNLILIYAIQIIIFPLSIIFFDISVKNPFIAFLVLTLGNFGFVVIGSMFSIFIINAKVKELLIPVLFLPIATPLLIVSTIALKKSFEGLVISNEIILIATYIIIMSSIAMLTFDYALEE